MLKCVILGNWSVDKADADLSLSNLIVLAEDAIRSAIKDYKSKRQRLNIDAAAPIQAAAAAA